VRPAILTWFKTFSRVSIQADLIAGITVALVLIPQSMAYAQLAGLPPYYGLYASFIPPMLAAMLGSSNQLQTGPVAVVSLMTAASLEPFARAGSEGFVAYAILLALIIGIFQLSLGLLRLGMVVNFLAHPVILGFTNAAAIIIGTSQLSKIFGVSVDEAEHHYQTVIKVIQEVFYYTHLPTLLLAILALVIMVGLKRINKKIPNVLVAVIVTTVISWAINFQYNKKIDISTIMDGDTLNVIELYNIEAKEVKELSERKTQKAEKFREAEKEYGQHCDESLEIKLTIDLINLNIAEHKETANEYRRILREYLFSAVKDGDKYKFYRKEKLPSEIKDDGRIWRLRVGNNPIDNAAITFMGGGSVIGEIPKGLPKFAMPKISISVALELFPTAVIIALLGFMEAISIAKAMATKTGQRLDPNQELVGQGLANIVGSFNQCYPVSGSFSRSAVNIQAGALTGMSSVFTSCIVALTLLFFTPLLYYLPQSVLAVVIMMAVVGLINIKGIIHAFHAQKYDGIIAVITFIITLAFAPHLDKGIMIGVALSLGHYLYRHMKPRVVVLSKNVDNVYRDADLLNLPRCDYITIIRFDGSLFFANTSYLEDQILERISVKKNLKHVFIVAYAINELDATGEEMLTQIISRLNARGIDISFVGLKLQILEVMRRTHLIEKIGDKNLFYTIEDAINSVYEKHHEDGLEQNCPLRPSNTLQ